MGQSDTLSGWLSLKPVLIIFITLLGLVLYSCSDSPTSGLDENGDTDPPGTEDPVTGDHPACEDLQLSAESGEPLDIIDIEGFTEDFGDEPIGWIHSDKDDERLVPIYINADYANESAGFILPLHPIHWMAGGETELTISNSDSTITCGGFQMNIEPLEPAPGETERFLDEFEAFITGLIERIGYDPAEVAGERVESLPAEVAPLVAALQGFDDEYVEDNIRAVLSGDAPMLEGQTVPDDAMMAVDALFGKASLTDTFSEGFAGKIMTQESSVNVLSCRGYKNMDLPPACLDFQVKLQNEFQNSVDGVSGAFYEFSAATLGAASIGLGVMALGTGGATAPAAVASGVAGNAMAIFNLVNDVMVHVLPSRFEGFEIVANPISFNEDSEEIGEWMSFIDFSSKGTTLTYQSIVGALPHGKLIDNRLFKSIMSEVSNKVAEVALSFSVNVWEVTAERGITYDPQTFSSFITPEREDEEEFFGWELRHLESWDGSQAFDYYVDLDTGEIDELKYIPLIEGKTELRTRINDGVFNLSPGPVSTTELILNPIEITIEPDDVVLYLSDFENEDLKVDLFAEVENADDEELEWDSEDQGEGFFMQNDDLGHEVTYFPPEEPGTYLVVAESVTETGPRQGRTPPRTESVRVRVMGEDDAQGMFFMQPNPGCVALDDEFTFEAFFGDPYEDDMDAVHIPFTDIFWDMQGPGALTDDGTFTADEEGVVDIAFLYEDPFTGDTYSTSASFVILEGCGELTVESDYFEYTTSCVSADSPEEFSIYPFDMSAVMAAGWSGLGGADLTITMEANIEEETGSWTRSFERTWVGFDGSGINWSIPNFIDNSGDEWQPLDESEVEDLSSETLDIERTEISVGDETIGLISGEFRITMFNLSEFERTDQYSDERTISTFTGEFSMIPIVEGISICE